MKVLRSGGVSSVNHAACPGFFVGVAVGLGVGLRVALMTMPLENSVQNLPRIERERSVYQRKAQLRIYTLFAERAIGCAGELPRCRAFTLRCIPFRTSNWLISRRMAEISHLSVRNFSARFEFVCV